MAKMYLIVCGLIALFLPHLSHESVTTFQQIGLQIGFLVIGWAGFNTFND